MAPTPGCTTRQGWWRGLGSQRLAPAPAAQDRTPDDETIGNNTDDEERGEE
jgi:hypothetical protein